MHVGCGDFKQTLFQFNIVVCLSNNAYPGEPMLQIKNNGND